MFDSELKIRNYKCFQDETGFETIRRVNLIIGRNNIGKSTLLELVLGKYLRPTNLINNDARPELLYTGYLTQQNINAIFGATRQRPDNLEYGQQYLNRKVKVSRGLLDERVLLVECDSSGIDPPVQELTDTNYSYLIANAVEPPLANLRYCKLQAERNILPEPANQELPIHKDGTGITNVIQNFLNQANLPSELVKNDMLTAINEIFSPDSTFTSIVCQQYENGNWEIFLGEKAKGEIALSQSGSGIKTVVCVVTYLYLLPYIESKDLKDYVFAFEELENNLHPALVRKLNKFIYEKALEHNFVYFLTTHSNILIDQFSKQEDAQIIHITQNNGITKCTTAKTYFDNNGILDDLDVRASDLFQANGVIWVEGPSDRIYLNRWIELWSEGKLKEGSHYQIVFLWRKTVITPFSK